MFTALLIPDFPVWALRRLHPELRDREVLVTSAGRLVACSEGLARQGIEPGWSAERAQARAPEAEVRVLAGAEGRLAWEEALEGLNRQTPWIETAGPGQATARFGAPAEAAAAASHLQARAGLAADRSTALVAAADAAPGDLAVVPPGGETEARDALPTGILARLGVGEATLERLHWLGFHSVGSLASLTREQLCAQFEEGALLDRLARCEDRRPVPLYHPPPVVAAEQDFEPPLVEPADYEPALRALVERSAAGLQGRRAAFLTVRLKEGTALHSARRLLQAPTDDAARLWTPARLALEQAHPGRACEITGLSVVLGGLSSPRRVQGTLWPVRPGAEAALRAVEARFPGRLMRIARVDPWAALPEEAATLEPLSWEEPGKGKRRR